MVNQVVPNYDRDPGPSAARRPSTCILARALAANTAESITVPDDANRVVFSSDLIFYANYTTTAAVPADTAITDAKASEPILPSSDEVSRSRIVVPGSTISVIATATTIVTASFYKT